MDLKSKVDKQNLLKWIKGANDSEPSHTNMTYRTGLDDPNTKAAAWFLETSEFQSWVANLIQDNAERVFWLKGISKTFLLVHHLHLLRYSQWVRGKRL